MLFGGPGSAGIRGNFVIQSFHALAEYPHEIGILTGKIVLLTHIVSQVEQHDLGRVWFTLLIGWVTLFF
jgi:hypothetical protein